MTSSYSNFSDILVEKSIQYNDYYEQFSVTLNFLLALLVAVAALIVAINSYSNVSTVFVVKKKGRDFVESNSENNTRGLYGQPAILAIGTDNPPHKVHKDLCDDFMATCERRGDIEKEQVEFVKKIRDSCGIDYRYSGIEPHAAIAGNSDDLFGKTLQEPVEKRNLYWAEFAKATAIQASKNAIESWGGDKTKITHVIFHSCTGFKAPGIELDIVDAIGLTGVKRRLGINFMGCFGGFTGLSVAKSFCLSDPGSIALVVCAESCVAHASNAVDRSELLGSVIFADGAAACLVGPGQHGDWALGNAKTMTLGKETRDMMTWFPSNTSYRMYLSKDIGNQFGVGLLLTIRNLVKTVLGGNLDMKNVDWCVHPGGKGLLDGLAKGIGSEKLRHSYSVLKNYGNMSSPTIFFVIKRLLDEAKETPSKKDAICLGFGPGLTAELCAIHKVM